MTTCPVCGMTVDERTAVAKADYDGRTYYFCSEDCKEKFQRDPARYSKSPATPTR